jgi:sigma-B regulation protein RsbU (phosphoserine phosphatase)
MRTKTLTKIPLRPPNLAEIDYDAFCRCNAEVTGNFYDFIPLESSRLAVSLGDLPNAGGAPSITISCLQALVRGLTVGSHGDVASLARELNGTLYLLGPRDFCTPWFYALIDPVRHELRYVNAAHEAPLLIRTHSGTVDRLERTGAALGFTARGTHHEEATSIDPGDVLAIFSEGVAETVSDARVLDVVLENPHAGAAELTRRIFEEADRAAQTEWPVADRTFAAVRVMDACARPLIEECAKADLVCAA